ncbi:hypothetical protein PFISCL1PPCAC_17677, partial [Pristionchus fissidentatus]
KKDGAVLPIIRSDEENTMFNGIIASFIDLLQNPALILGMVCNSSTRRLEWMDGSEITFTKNNVNVNIDCVADGQQIASFPSQDSWYTYPTTESYYWTVL